MPKINNQQSKIKNALCFVSCICLIPGIIATIAIAAPSAAQELEASEAFQNAERLQAEDKTQEALSAFEEILKKYPDTSLKYDTLVRIAQCYSQLGDDDSAIEIYLKFITDDPNSIEASQAVSMTINLYSERYQFDEVIAMSKQLAQQFPGTEAAAMALYRAASYLYSQEKFRDAIQEYERFIEQFPKSVMRLTAFSHLIYLYIKEGMFKEAELRLMDKLAQTPSDTYILRQLALVYQKQGEYDKALEIYQRILAVYPEDVDIYEQLGELYAEKGDKEKAIAEWSKIVESSPEQYSRHQMLAQILKTHGFYDQAAAECQKAIELQPMISYLYTQLAELNIIRKRFDSAVDVYLDALMKFPIGQPGRAEITKDMLELCELEKLYGKVISRLKAILISSPENIPALLTLADVYFYQGNFDDSLQMFRTISSLYPDEGGTLFDYAQILERERHYDYAIRFYQTLLDLFPSSGISSRALMQIGQLKSRLNQPESAIASLRMLISSFSKEASAYMLIGDIYLQQMHDVQAAFSTYTEAKRIVEAQPDNADLSIQSPDLDLRIAECYRLMGKYDAAESILDSIQTGHRSRSIVAQAAKLRGDCYFSRGDFDSALTQYQESIRWLMNEDWVNDSLDRIAMIKEYSDQSSRAILNVYSQVERLRKSGQYNEALALCTSAIKQHGPIDIIQLELGELLTLQMKFTEAISVYKQLIQPQSSLSPEAQYRIAGIYSQQLNNPQQAIGEYAALIEKYPDSVLAADARNQIRRLAASQKASKDNIP